MNMSDYVSRLCSSKSMVEMEEKLRFCNYGLDLTKGKAHVERQFYLEMMKHWFVHLTNAKKERDEAKDRLQKSIARTQELEQLLNKISPSVFPGKTSPTVSQMQSVISDYKSETYNSNSQGSSSSADCVSNGVVSSPAFTNANAFADSSKSKLKQQPFVGSHGYNQMGGGEIPFNNSAEDIVASIEIEKLTNGKPLPEKGQLFKAVVNAAPILFGTFANIDPVPTPQWRNPPSLLPLLQSLPSLNFNPVHLSVNQLRGAGLI